MADRKFIYRPSDCSSDAQLIERLTQCLQNHIKYTDYYLQHWGSYNKASMFYWKNKSEELLQQMFTPPQKNNDE